MAIFADVTLPDGRTTCKVRISPHIVAETSAGGHYHLRYMIGDRALAVWPEHEILPFKGNTARFKAGHQFDRGMTGRQNVYADLKAKAAAGELTWLSNIHNPDGTPFPGAEYVAPAEPVKQQAPDQKVNIPAPPPAAPAPSVEILHRGKALKLVPADALALFGALAMAVDGKTATLRLASGEAVELTHEEVSDLGRQLAGTPADAVSEQDRGTGAADSSAS